LTRRQLYNILTIKLKYSLFVQLCTTCCFKIF